MKIEGAIEILTDILTDTRNRVNTLEASSSKTKVVIKDDVTGEDYLIAVSNGKAKLEKVGE